jgi:hypothetical protein
MELPTAYCATALGSLRVFPASVRACLPFYYCFTRRVTGGYCRLLAGLSTGDPFCGNMPATGPNRLWPQV